MVDSLITVTPADSSAIVTGVNSLLAGWGLPPQVVGWLSTALLGLPTVAVVLLTRIPVFSFIAPAFHLWLDPLWERNKGWLNPLLALLVGWVGTGNPLVGTAAVALHQVATAALRAAKGTPASTQAARVGAIVALLVLSTTVGVGTSHAKPYSGVQPAAITAPAAPALLPWLSVHRFVGTVAFGQSWADLGSKLPPASYGRVGVGYQILSPLQLNAGARRWLQAGEKWRPEVELRLIFAP